MANIQDAISTRVEYDNQFEKRQDKPWGIIIALEGNLHPPGRNNFSYIAMYGRPGSAFEAVNDTALKTVGIPVQLVRDAILPYYRVVGAYTEGIPQTNQPISNSGVGPHGENHQIPTEANIGEDPVYIYPPAWIPLKCTLPSSNATGFVVEIQEFSYNYLGAQRVFNTTQINLADSQNGPGFDAMVLIYLNPRTNLLETIESEEFPESTPDNAPLPFLTIPFHTYPSAQVRIRGTATEFFVGDITDARLLSPNLVPDFNGALLSTRLASTGLLEGGIITLSTPTTVDISAGSGLVIDNSVEPPETTEVEWPAFTNVTINGLVTDILTDLGITAGGSLVQQVTPFTRAQYRDIIILGRVAHVDFESVVSIAPFLVPIHDSALLAVDVIGQVGPFLQGYIYSDNGPASLEMARTEGELMRVGISFHDTPEDPHVRIDAALSPVTFGYAYRDGIGGFTYVVPLTDVDPGNWDDGTGVLDSVIPARWTAQRIYIPSGTGGTIMQYGQQEYQTRSDALVDLFAQVFETDPAIQELTTFWGWLVIRGNATDLSDISQATFVDAETGTINSSGNTIFELFTYQPISTGETFKLSTLYRLDASAGSVVNNLPAAPSIGSFVEFVINAITPPNTITIDGNGETINGSATVVYENSFDVFRKIRMVFDTEWHEYRDNAGVEWQNEWVSRTYDLDDMVRDGSWTMIANKITTDRPAPQPIGPEIPLLPDAPAWTITPVVDSVQSGLDIEIVDGLWSIVTFSAWVQDISGSTKYRVLITNVLSGESSITDEFDGSSLTAPGWVDVGADSNVLDQGDNLQISLLSDNHSATTNFFGNWIHSTGTTDIVPASGNSFRRTNRLYIRFNYIDNDTTDRTVELQSVIFNTTLTSSLGASYVIIDGVDGGTYIEYEITIISEPTTGLQVWTFVIPTPISTDYNIITDHWLVQPSVRAIIQGFFGVGGADPVLNNNAYGVRFTFQEYIASDDWDIVALSGGGGSSGGGSGGVDTFDALLDTPANKVSQAGKLSAVNAGETALEYVDIYHNAGALGIGTAAPAQALHLLGAGVGTGMRIGFDTQNYLNIEVTSANRAQLVFLAQAGSAEIDFAPFALDFSSQVEFTFFRNSNTTGPAITSWYEGDGTTAINAVIAGKGADSFVNALTGNFGVGTATPSEKLEVDGRILANGITEGTYVAMITNLDDVTGSAVSDFMHKRNDLVRWVFRAAGAEVGAETGTDLFIRSYDDLGGLQSPSVMSFVRATGNVGIGVDAPEYLLHVLSATTPRILVEATTASDRAILQVQHTTGLVFSNLTAWGTTAVGNSAGTIPRASLIEWTGGNNTGFLINQSSGQPLIFATSNAERMRIDSAGLVGINTTSPTSSLHITRSGSQDGFIKLQGDSGATNSVIGMTYYENSTIASTIQHRLSGAGSNPNELRISNLATSGFITLGTNSGEKVRVDNAGNVGIGTTTPDYSLEIEGTLPRFAFNITDANNWGQFRFLELGVIKAQVSYNASNFPTASRQENLEFLNLTANGNITFLTNNDPVARMIVDSGGLVGIGTETPTTRLHIKGGGGLLHLDESGTNILDMYFSRQSSLRWIFRIDNVAESGSNVGSDFNIITRDDAGGFLANAFFIKRSDGSVGIGTGAPQANLHVRNAGGNGAIRVSGSGTTSGFDMVSSANEAFVINRDVGGITFRTQNITRMVINYLGEVGFGQSAPTYRVDILSPTGGNVLRTQRGTSTMIMLQSNDGDGFIGMSSNDGLRFRTNNVDVGKWNAAGNLSVGTITATAKLHVDQSSTTAAIPTLTLDQGDESEEFINFVSAFGGGRPSDPSAVGTPYARIRVSINGVFKYIQVYNA